MVLVTAPRQTFCENATVDYANSAITNTALVRNRIISSSFFSSEWSRVIRWSIDRLIDWLINLLIDWLINPLIHWLIDWLIRWSIDWLIDWLESVLWYFAAICVCLWQVSLFNTIGKARSNGMGRRERQKLLMAFKEFHPQVYLQYAGSLDTLWQRKSFVGTLVSLKFRVCFFTSEIFLWKYVSKISGAFGGGARGPWPPVKSRGRGEKANTPPFDNLFWKLFKKHKQRGDPLELFSKNVSKGGTLWNFFIAPPFKSS